jgi:ATP-dependent Clp protease ATP-binding subunit ClpB
MDLNKFTEKAQQAVLASQQLAESQHHSQINVEHLLISLLRQEDGIAPQILRKLGADVNEIARQVESELS